MEDDKHVELPGPKPGAKDLKAKEVKMWFSRIKKAQRSMEDRLERWDKYINLLKGSEGGEGVPEDNVNLMPSTLAIVLNNLWTRDREVFGYSDNAELAEKILPALQNRMRRLIKKLRPYRQFRSAIGDALMFGNGFLEVGYSTRHFGGGDERSDGLVIETRANVLRGLPYILRVSPRCVYVDPQATDLDDAKWAITVERRPRSELEKNKNYQNVGDIKVGSDPKLDEIFKDADHRKSIEGDPAKEEDPLIVLYKVQDKSTNATFVLAQGLPEKTVIRPEYGALPFAGFSLEMFRFNEVPDEFWGLSEIGQWAPFQQHLSELRTTMLDNSKRLALIWLVGRGRVSKEDLGKLIAAESRTFVEVDDPTAIAPLPAPAMPQEWGMMDAMIQNDIRNISNISDFERGGETSAKTATEVTARQQASAGRGQPMRDDVTEVINRVMGKVGVILTTLMMQPGDDPIEEGEVEWQMDAPSAQAFSPAVRRKTMTDVLINLMQVESMKPGTVNILEAVKQWLTAQDIQDVEKLVFENISSGSGLTPDEENLRLMAGLPVMPSQDENFEAHLKSHAALMELPEVQAGHVDTSAIVGHIEATMQMAAASGVMLSGGPMAGGGPNLEQLQQQPVTDAGIMSAANR